MDKELDNNETERRPIKVTMKNTADKHKVMDNLRLLKGTTHEFGRISITDDYTKTQREQIKKYSQMAKEKSDQSEEFIYKVRGNPKNGLRLVKFTRK